MASAKGLVDPQLQRASSKKVKGWARIMYILAASALSPFHRSRVWISTLFYQCRLAHAHNHRALSSQLVMTLQRNSNSEVTIPPFQTVKKPIVHEKINVPESPLALLLYFLVFGSLQVIPNPNAVCLPPAASQAKTNTLLLLLDSKCSEILTEMAVLSPKGVRLKKWGGASSSLIFPGSSHCPALPSPFGNTYTSSVTVWPSKWEQQHGSGFRVSFFKSQVLPHLEVSNCWYLILHAYFWSWIFCPPSLEQIWE